MPDKKFYWENLEHAQFKLDEDTGMIYIKSGTHDGRYHLRFKVYDRKHTQTDVPANVTVTVKTIPHEAVLNSGSVRISGMTDEDFIRVWDYRVCFIYFQKFTSLCEPKKFLLRYDHISIYLFYSRKTYLEVKRIYSETNWRIY